MNLQKPPEIEILSSLEDIEQFKQTRVFKDLQTFTRVRREIIQRGLEDVNAPFPALKVLQGEMKQLQDFNTFISWLKTLIVKRSAENETG